MFADFCKIMPDGVSLNRNI